MTKTKFTTEQKIQIVLESIKTSISIAELCRKHNVHPPTFQTWQQKFMEADKAEIASNGLLTKLWVVVMLPALIFSI